MRPREHDAPLGPVSRREALRLLALAGSAVLTRQAGTAAQDQSADLDAWLAAHPLIRNRIVWTAGDGRALPIAAWPAAMRGRLGAFYQGLLAGRRDLGIRLPDVAPFKGYFAADVAFDIYAAHVAHVLVVEARHLVPWSIERRPAVELDQLLAGASYFARIKPSKRTLPPDIQADRDFMQRPENVLTGELNSDPRIGFDFVTGKTSMTHATLAGATELETLCHLTAWLRDNVGHGPLGDGHLVDRMNGLRWLDQRLRAFPGMPWAIANQGCHSAAKLIVDLARSVNIPLLHTLSLDSHSGDAHTMFLDRTHAGLVYGWGGARPRMCWHTDTLYAREGKICFPIDERTGALLPQREADQRFFDASWLSPAELSQTGFVPHLETVFPDRGDGHDSRGVYEQNWDYGTMLGRWKLNDAGLDELYDWSRNYDLCGADLLQLSCNRVVTVQLQRNFAKWRGVHTEAEMPPMPSFAAFETRAAAGVNALGGRDKCLQAIRDKRAALGRNLLA
jgi:hypothetical protein